MTTKRELNYYTHQCRHFNGIQRDTCEAGVDYSTMRDYQPGYRMARWPCTVWKGDEAATKCDKRDPYTPEESAAIVQKQDEAVTKLLKDLESGLCPHCGAKVEREQQVGPCVYAHPCGHRLGQGKARKIGRESVSLNPTKEK